MMRASCHISAAGKADPAKGARFIRRYEDRINGFTRKYLKAARQILADEFNEPALRHAIPITITPELVKTLQSLATSFGPDILKIASESTKESYQQGIKFGTQQLKSTGMTKTLPTTFLGADYRALDILETRNLQVLTGITADINDAIIREVSAGLTKGEDFRDIAARLSELTGMTEERAYRIARYETMFSLNQGTIIRYYQSGVEKVEWITGGDEHTCDECMDLDGQVFDIDKVPDCPLHINCRCTLAPIVYQEREYGMKAIMQNRREQVITALQTRAGYPPAYLYGQRDECCCRAKAVI